MHLDMWTDSSDQQKLKPNIRIGKKSDSSNFERGPVVGEKQAGVSISEMI